MAIFLGIDTGGTFTDFVVIDGATVRIHKELSTPEAPERSILRGIEALGLRGVELGIVHGSTVGTNAVLERKGVRTAFITNRGLRDLLTIGRQARAELYNLRPVAKPPPVPRELCLETGGRLGARGEVVEPLTEADLGELRAAIAALAPASVAITLLFSFLDDRYEQSVAAAMPAGVFVSCSAEVLPEYREYERGIATWLNAYVGPIMQGYLTRLAAHCAPARLSVMQSSGLACAPAFAGGRAVNLLLSGPAGGLQGARYVAEMAGRTRLLTFDMGGTSTDVALVEGEPTLTSEGRIGPYPVGVAMVDLHTIGAGGGSIARVDAGGLLHVGPESAGAAPGPACYGRGGRLPTVTDAHLLLGRLPRSARLGGTLRLDYAAAHAAYVRLGAALGGIAPEAAAEGVIALANERMHQALRVISVERGADARAHTLVSFGGAGGLHVCELAASLAMRIAMVPAQAGVLSALGMLAASAGRQLSRTVRRALDEFADAQLERLFASLAATGCAELASEGVSPIEVSAHPTVDLCYTGQSFTLNLPWTTGAAAAEAFHLAHANRYGHRLEVAIQLVNVRLRLSAARPEFTLPRHRARAPHAPAGFSGVYGIRAPVPIWHRDRLRPSEAYAGPLVVLDAISTTYLAPDWQLAIDDFGNCLLNRA